MKTSSIVVSILLVLGSVCSSAQAATVEVTFTEPKNFTDLRSGEQNRKQFRDDVFYNFEKQLKKLAKALPEEQLLKIEFTDIDLAGEIDMLNARLFRVVKNVYSPRLAFKYQLIAKDKSLVLEGEENIRDTSFMTHGNLRYKNQMFGYEKQVLDNWFDDTFTKKE